MTAFEPKTSEVGYDRSTYSATTPALGNKQFETFLAPHTLPDGPNL